jgi:uncharacterized membrane protein YgcG
LDLRLGEYMRTLIYVLIILVIFSFYNESFSQTQDEVNACQPESKFPLCLRGVSYGLHSLRTGFKDFYPPYYKIRVVYMVFNYPDRNGSFGVTAGICEDHQFSEGYYALVNHRSNMAGDYDEQNFVLEIWYGYGEQSCGLSYSEHLFDLSFELSYVYSGGYPNEGMLIDINGITVQTPLGERFHPRDMSKSQVDGSIDFLDGSFASTDYPCILVGNGEGEDDGGEGEGGEGEGGEGEGGGGEGGGGEGGGGEGEGGGGRRRRRRG